MRDYVWGQVADLHVLRVCVCVRLFPFWQDGTAAELLGSARSELPLAVFASSVCHFMSTAREEWTAFLHLTLNLAVSFGRASIMHGAKNTTRLSENRCQDRKSFITEGRKNPFFPKYRNLYNFLTLNLHELYKFTAVH